MGNLDRNRMISVSHNCSRDKKKKQILTELVWALNSDFWQSYEIAVNNTSS